MKHLHLICSAILLALFVSACTTPVSEDSARKLLFSDNWAFFLGDSSTLSTTNYDHSHWRKLDLPHDWSIEGVSKKNNPSEGDGGFFPTGTGWYRKSFTAPSEWKKKKVSIYFEGVYMNSELYINGALVGKQPYGYTSFRYDITPFLKFDEKNSFAVRVDNSQQKNCRWYSGSGIYRHVWLQITDSTHIKHWGVAISTPVVSKTSATVEINTTVVNESNSTQELVISTLLTDKKEALGTTNILQITLEANQQQIVTQQLTVQNPKLWSPETPHLYQAQISIKKGNAIIDETTEAFGIRSIVFNAENGFLLNGKQVLINGGCVHHDNGCLGAAAYDRAEVRKVELLKQAGFNAVRTSHNPPSEAFLHACDSLGLLVVDEIFDGWRTKKTPHDYAKLFDKWWRHDLESMVRRDRNHPSIILWSIGNEIIERTKPEAVATAKMLAEAVRTIDPTRPITSAMTSWNEGWEIFDPLMAEHDVCGYNYQLHNAASDHKRVPSRVILHTESYPKDAFYCWNMGQSHPYVIGDFVWTALDYIGESGIGRYYYPGETDGEHWQANLFPWHGAYCGDIDLTGWRKPISHYRSMLYNNTEKLYMAVREPNPENGKIKLTSWAVWPTWESWTWPQHKGKAIDVEVYSKHPKVRLYLNNKLVGEKPTTINEKFKATFTLPYAKGELKAVALDNGKEVESTTLKTANNATDIKLTADRSTILADGQDLSYITVEVTDSHGTIDPNAENRFQFNLLGDGVIIGVDNANLKDTDLYVSNSRKAWHGRALVVVKSTKTAGNITLKVSANGLQTADITITTQKSKQNN